MMGPVLNNEDGKVLASILAFLFLVYFAGTIFLFFLYREGLFRYEFGIDKTAAEEQVFDKNRVLELIRKEKFLEEELAQLTLEKKALQELKKQVDVEKGQLLEDREYITKKMEAISEKFQQLSDEEEKNLLRLSSMYAKMKANRVANIFKELEAETVANLLIRMQDKVSAKILGEIGVQDSKRAAHISNIIEGKVKKNLFNAI